MIHIEHASSPVIAVIFINYLIYAINVFRIAYINKVDPRRAQAFGLLAGVFVFCGLCGYVTTFLSQDYWIYREGLHWILAGLSVWLNVSNQAEIMAEMMRANDEQGHG